MLFGNYKIGTILESPEVFQFKKNAFCLLKTLLAGSKNGLTIEVLIIIWYNVLHSSSRVCNFLLHPLHGKKLPSDQDPGARTGTQYQPAQVRRFRIFDSWPASPFFHIVSLGCPSTLPGTSTTNHINIVFERFNLKMLYKWNNNIRNLKS